MNQVRWWPGLAARQEAADPALAFDLAVLRREAWDRDAAGVRRRGASICATHLPRLSRDAGSLAGLIGPLLLAEAFELAARVLRASTGWRLAVAVVQEWEVPGCTAAHELRRDPLQAVLHAQLNGALWMRTERIDAFDAVATDIVAMARSPQGRV